MTRKKGSKRSPLEYPFDVDVGEALLPRTSMFASGQSVGLANMGWTYFRSRRKASVTKLRSFVTSAGASNTLCREAIYSVNTSDWSLTAILASTTNDTAAYSSTGKKERTLSSTFSEALDTIYARAILVVGGTMPGFAGMYFGSSDEAALAPPVFGVRYGPLSDLPSSVSAAQLSLIGWGYQGYLLDA